MSSVLYIARCQACFTHDTCHAGPVTLGTGEGGRSAGSFPKSRDSLALRAPNMKWREDHAIPICQNPQSPGLDGLLFAVVSPRADLGRLRQRCKFRNPKCARLRWPKDTRII